MDITVPLAMFCLDTLQLNEELCNRTQNLKDTLIEFEVMENRQLNQRYLFAWMVSACIDAVYLWMRYLYSSAGVLVLTRLKCKMGSLAEQGTLNRTHRKKKSSMYEEM